jgi:molybdopterin/thiamine biosynthesis adenylyltransferase
MSSEIQTRIRKQLYEKTKKIADPAGRKVEILEDAQALKLAEECQTTVSNVYAEALALGIYPYRYLRNREAISLGEQLRLLTSRVAVIGAGGLGGHVILLLARLGIGTLVVVDYDVFDETNLNRQALSNMETLGKSKSEVAVRTVRSINPGVRVIPNTVKLDSSNASDILTGSDVAVDALDNVPDRFVLERTTKKLGIPLVHGALAGFEGQIMTIFPDDPGLQHLYRDGGASEDKANRPESVLGVPTLTPSLIASLEAMEVLKIVLKRGKIFRHTMAHVDLETGQMNEFVFEKRQS